jgi:outer membrane protein OmpA-like peptidoglycan-associated protein
VLKEDEVTRSRLLLVSLLAVLLFGCAAKENLIVPSTAGGDPAGTLQLSNTAGVVVFGEDGKAVRLSGRKSRPEKVVLSEEQKQKLFGEALAVQPLAPVSFSLTFEFGNDSLTQASRDLFPQILATIKERDSRDVTVIGHTDRVGGEEYNYKLGLARAENIREMLIAQGVESTAITALSYGEGDALVVTEKNVPEERNRRVVVVIR